MKKENEPSKSKKRKLKKQEQARQKRAARRERQEQEQSESGKLIEENHNGGLYTAEYTEKAADWIWNLVLGQAQELGTSDLKYFMFFFRTWRPRSPTLILKWSDDVPRDTRWTLFVNLLDIYRETKEEAGELLLTKIKEICG